jgi:hypothetical protein
VAQGELGAMDVQYLVDGNKRYYLAEENDRNGPVQFCLGGNSCPCDISVCTCPFGLGEPGFGVKGGGWYDRVRIEGLLA